MRRVSPSLLLIVHNLRAIVVRRGAGDRSGHRAGKNSATDVPLNTWLWESGKNWLGLVNFVPGEYTFKVVCAYWSEVVPATQVFRRVAAASTELAAKEARTRGRRGRAGQRRHAERTEARRTAAARTRASSVVRLPPTVGAARTPPRKAGDEGATGRMNPTATPARAT